MKKRSSVSYIGFNLYCNKRQYYKCYIFDTIKRMQAWNSRDNNEYIRGNYRAIVKHYKKWKLRGGHWSEAACIGTVTFAVTDVSAAIVAHELNHASLFWFIYKWSPLKLWKPRYFERLASVEETLTRQFWSKWYELEEEGSLKKLGTKRLAKK